VEFDTCTRMSVLRTSSDSVLKGGKRHVVCLLRYLRMVVESSWLKVRSWPLTSAWPLTAARLETYPTQLIARPSNYVRRL
jgi:hypothetical protein